MNVESIMTKNPACCTPDMDLTEAAQLMLRYDCGEIPVVFSKNDKKILGVITDRDICTRAVAIGLNPAAMHVGQCMSYPVISIRNTTSIEDCCQIMEDHQIRRLPVVDDNESCCGIISLADIARYQESYLTAEVVKHISQPGSGRFLF